MTNSAELARFIERLIATHRDRLDPNSRAQINGLRLLSRVQADLADGRNQSAQGNP